jgi:hypothetical protein
MGWQISVGDGAKAALRSLDASLKEELISQVDGLANHPAGFLTRASDASAPGATWAYSYKSEVVVGLQITLYFAGLNEYPPRLELVGIAHVIDEQT